MRYGVQVSEPELVRLWWWEAIDPNWASVTLDALVEADQALRTMKQLGFVPHRVLVGADGSVAFYWYGVPERYACVDFEGGMPPCAGMSDRVHRPVVWITGDLARTELARAFRDRVSPFLAGQPVVKSLPSAEPLTL